MKKTAVLLAFAVSLLGLTTVMPVSAGEKMKVVYQVTDAEKVPFVLGNIRNHLKGGGGPGKLDIVLVVYGPAGKMFHKDKTTDKVKQKLAGLLKDGVQLNMCGNTMRAQKVQLSDLLPGFTRRDEGGVVRIAELQSQGYIYIRP